MKRVLFSGLMLMSASTLIFSAPTSSTPTASTPPTQEQFNQSLKTQKDPLAKSCLKQNLKANPKLSPMEREKLKGFCSCIAEVLTTDPSYATKQYQIISKVKTQAEYNSKIQTLGTEVSKMCQQKLMK
ncbi:MAG: hypothetical protein WDW20_03295 [Neisseriaceae bacterium]